MCSRVALPLRRVRRGRAAVLLRLRDAASAQRPRALACRAPRTATARSLTARSSASSCTPSSSMRPKMVPLIESKRECCAAQVQTLSARACKARRAARARAGGRAPSATAAAAPAKCGSAKAVECQCAGLRNETRERKSARTNALSSSVLPALPSMADAVQGAARSAGRGAQRSVGFKAERLTHAGAQTEWATYGKTASSRKRPPQCSAAPPERVRVPAAPARVSTRDCRLRRFRQAWAQARAR